MVNSERMENVVNRALYDPVVNRGPNVMIHIRAPLCFRPGVIGPWGVGRLPEAIAFLPHALVERALFIGACPHSIGPAKLSEGNVCACPHQSV